MSKSQVRKIANAVAAALMYRSKFTGGVVFGCCKDKPGGSHQWMTLKHGRDAIRRAVARALTRGERRSK